MGPHIVQFDVIMRKMLEVVRALPFSADDVHNTRNAHGTFADTLRELADRRQAARLKTEKVTCCFAMKQHSKSCTRHKWLWLLTSFGIIQCKCSKWWHDDCTEDLRS